ncbi:response regulator transcription factor [Cohnella caldifontis]|uniref:response regulator transcription factor n=1 Tax=Cohnella caldifontis TaxID=3027471 RepID=UPI0023EDBD45|nr:response regulator transcription factor [Cohnella sp. YIM B05605]
MYKAIIVDDEAVVRNGLKRTIDWNAHGFELIGDYENGREAWEGIERAKPDLVISDISMPFMDGLELTGLISSQFPYIKVIILTGYDEFEYARQAIRLKVSDFILKPITAGEIRLLLDKVRREMDEEARRHDDISRLKAQLNQSLPLLKERFLERMVVLGMGKSQIEERFAFFGLPPIRPGYLVLIADVDDFGDRMQQGIGDWDGLDAEFLRFAAFNIFGEVAARESLLLFRTREDRMAALLSGTEDEGALYEKAYRIAEEVKRLIEKYLKFTVSFGVGRACRSTEQLPAAYKSALAALDYRFLLGKNRVHGILDLEGQSPSPAPSPDWDRRLSAAVKTGTAEEAARLIEEGVAEMKAARIPIDACFLQMQNAVLSLLKTLQELPADAQGDGLDPLTVMDVYRFKTVDEVKEWLQQAVRQIMSAIAAGRGHLVAAQMRRAVEYIESHYADENLSLQDMCRHALMSTSYFSSLFKQHTGETFVEYLTGVRMAKAKELLLHSSLKFYEIAEKVGYADPNYFSFLFKKRTGRSPKEYREQQGKEPT